MTNLDSECCLVWSSVTLFSPIFLSHCTKITPKNFQKKIILAITLLIIKLFIAPFRDKDGIDNEKYLS